MSGVSWCWPGRDSLSISLFGADQVRPGGVRSTNARVEFNVRCKSRPISPLARPPAAAPRAGSAGPRMKIELAARYRARYSDQVFGTADGGDQNKWMSWQLFGIDLHQRRANRKYACFWLLPSNATRSPDWISVSNASTMACGCRTLPSAREPRAQCAAPWPAPAGPGAHGGLRLASHYAAPAWPRGYAPGGFRFALAARGGTSCQMPRQIARQQFRGAQHMRLEEICTARSILPARNALRIASCSSSDWCLYAGMSSFQPQVALALAVQRVDHGDQPRPAGRRIQCQNETRGCAARTGNDRRSLRRDAEHRRALLQLCACDVGGQPQRSDFERGANLVNLAHFLHA